MTLSRRKLLQQTLLTAPVISSSMFLTPGANALAEPGTNTSGSAPSAAPLIVVRAGESRAGKPWNIEGTPHVWNKISGKDVGGQLTLLEVTTPASVGPPMHIHEIQNEWMFLVDGSFGIQAGNERAVLHAGDSFLVQAGVPHAYVVLGSVPARHLLLFNPAGEMEAFFAEYDQNHMSSPNQNPAAASALVKKYRTRTVGPPLKASSFAL